MAKTKGLIRCAVTEQLICVFVLAYANCWFSDVVAQVGLILDYQYLNSSDYRASKILCLI